jgi:nucleoside-diphosphate-sugar epimerase
MKLLIFGMGYTARALLDEWPADWPRDIVATTRSRDKADALAKEGLTARVFPGEDLAADLAEASHVLVTAGPKDGRDPVLAHLRDAFAEARHLEWVGYLSTTGVYGDHAGGWVDEDTPLTPSTDTGPRPCGGRGGMAGAPPRPRPAAAHLPACRDLRTRTGPVRQGAGGHGAAHRQAGQVFQPHAMWRISRRCWIASIRQPNPGRVYNLCDDDPAPPQDVIAMPPTSGPAAAARDPLRGGRSVPMARSFYAESKRVRNDRIKRELGVRLKYPDYRSGLAQLLSAETRRIVFPPAANSCSQGQRPLSKGPQAMKPFFTILLFGALLLSAAGCSKFIEYTGTRSHPPRGEQIDTHPDALASRRGPRNLRGGARLRAAGTQGRGRRRAHAGGRLHRRPAQSQQRILPVDRHRLPQRGRHRRRRGGRGRSGRDIFIHGTPRPFARVDDWTAGCIAVTNREMRLIYAMVQDGTPITILP